MKYRELMELYKSGKLSQEDKEKVEKDIERQQAISEYLFDAEEIPEFEGMEAPKDIGDNDAKDTEDLKFTKMVRTSIQKAFVKMGMIVGAVVLAVILFVIFALPHVVDCFYYDPSEHSGGSNDIGTNRISLDLSVYSELFLPETYRDNVIVDSEGYGEYIINIVNNKSFTGRFNDVGGKIERGKLMLYDTDLLDVPYYNMFIHSLAGVEDDFVTLEEGYGVPDYTASLQELKDGEEYFAYITLDRVISYSELLELSEGDFKELNPMWCAVCQKNDKGYFNEENVGFLFNMSSIDTDFDAKKYPYLTQFDVSLSTGPDKDWVVSEEVMTTHMVSMLRYMADNEEFFELLYPGDSGSVDSAIEKYGSMADNVEENGLNIYGFVTVADKETLIEYSNKEGIAYIKTNPIR